ncbi:MAG TPA: hypothetical protein VFA90_18350 [Terriglobales bacterium]|nr:hypothetical protein [Terriglobales bacterium]
MSALLDDIINLAINGDQPLPDILRKCLLLGHELKNNQLKAWANQELNGYEFGKDVPEYRIITALARGNFLGPGWAQYNHHLIPPAVLEKEHREFAERVYLLQSVTAYVDVLNERDANSSRGSLTFSWPSNMVAYYQDRLMQGGFICHAAWQEISASAVAEMLDTIRNRTLNMALQIKDELGTSYTNLPNIERGETASRIQNIVFQNTGGNTTVAFDRAKVGPAQHQTIITVGNRETLDEALIGAGLEKQDVQALTDSIAADSGKPGNSVNQWIKKNASKVLAGGAKWARRSDKKSLLLGSKRTSAFDREFGSRCFVPSPAKFESLPSPGLQHLRLVHCGDGQAFHRAG